MVIRGDKQTSLLWMDKVEQISTLQEGVTFVW